MYDETNDDGLKMIYCSHCGSKLSRMEDGGRCGIYCNHCKTEYIVTLQNQGVTQVPSRKKQPGPSTRQT